jgi:hypothetical protein
VTIPDREVTLFAAGWRDGWLACERALGDDWVPIAERVRRDRGLPDWKRLVELRGEREVTPGEYRTMPLASDRTGDHLVADARREWAAWEQRKRDARGTAA